MTHETRLRVDREADVVAARQRGRELAAEAGISGSDLTVVATAISEIARNIISYAERGEIVLKIAQRGRRRGLIIIASDQGPGIADIEMAMRDGFSTGRSLGLGLPGARRLMDDFEIVSELGEGVTVTMAKWAR
jgi:serine/threonine-protein kinase RsbT